MLQVKRFILISSAEEKARWLYRVKRQWDIEMPLAVRVKGKTEIILGTTIPKDVSYNQKEKIWGIVWDEGIPPHSSKLDQSVETQEECISTVAAPVTTEHTDINEYEDHNDHRNGTDSSGCSSLSSSLDPGKCQEGQAGIDVSKCMADGILVIEVINVIGKVQCVSIVNVSSAFRSDSGQKFSILLVPNRVKSVGDNTIYGLMEFYVADASSSDENMGRAVGIRESDRAPTPVIYSDIKFSADALYFPACFLTGTGTYIVSNVIIVENCEDKVVSIELVVTGDGSVMRISPPQVTLHQKFEIGFFVCTWNAFKTFTTTGNARDGGTIRVRALITADDKSMPPMDIHLHNEPPRPAEISQGYLLWVNTTMIANISCSRSQKKMIEARLPVFSILSEDEGVHSSKKICHDIEKNDQ